MSWDELTELLAGELRRVVDTHGNEAIYGGSYGWASAGRFHHAQSQVHRFLKLLGGYTFSRHSYSLGATGVIMPRVVGTHDDLFKRSTQWDVIVEHTDLLVCFGGIGVEEHRESTTAAPPAIRRATRCGGSVTAAGASCRSRRCATTSTATANGTHRCLAPTSRSCSPWPTCWPPSRWPTVTSSTRTAPATTASSAICSAPTTVCRSRRSGRRRSAVCPPINWSPCPADGGRPHHRHRQLVAAADRGTVSRRRGWASLWRRCSARSVFPAAVSATATARMNEPGTAAAAVRAADTAAGRQPGADVHPRRRDQRHAAASGRAVRLQRADADLSGHQVRVLGGRQPVPPPPEHSAAAAGAGPRRHDRRARPVLDGDGQARRHRRAVDHRRSSATTTRVPATTPC